MIHIPKFVAAQLGAPPQDYNENSIQALDPSLAVNLLLTLHTDDLKVVSKRLLEDTQPFVEEDELESLFQAMNGGSMLSVHYHQAKKLHEANLYSSAIRAIMLALNPSIILNAFLHTLGTPEDTQTAIQNAHRKATAFLERTQHTFKLTPAIQGNYPQLHALDIAWKKAQHTFVWEAINTLTQEALHSKDTLKALERLMEIEYLVNPNGRNFGEAWDHIHKMTPNG